MTGPDPSTSPGQPSDTASTPDAPPPPSAATPPPGATPPASSTEPWPGPDRRESRSAGLVAGIVLIVVGAVFLVLRLGDIALGPEAWPLWLVIPGLAMLGGSLFIPARGGLGLAVLGVILATVGVILWVQSAYDVYSSWAYAWALVAPTGPGIAMLVYGLAHGDRELAGDGLRTSLVGIGLFLGFALFFEGVVGISGHKIENLDQVLPFAAIVLGALLIVLAVVDGGRSDRRRAERAAARARRRADRAARRAS